MPVMDGLEATRTIRAWERERGLVRTPILALTASALDEDVRHTLEAGVDMHVTKPIKKAVLIAAIEQSTRSPYHLGHREKPERCRGLTARNSMAVSKMLRRLLGASCMVDLLDHW